MSPRFIDVEIRIGDHDGYINYRTAVIDTVEQRVIATCDRRDDAGALAAVLSADGGDSFTDAVKQARDEVPF